MRPTVAEMVGEFLREGGVLVTVFYEVTSLLSGIERIRLSLAFAGTALGLFSWALGVWVERTR
ncbi:MAG TPA: hypothetical protein VGK08_00350 [Thermoanaerobaculia bacterium]